MDIMELIRHRRSVRTFDKTALKEEDAQKIIEYASGVENPYGQKIEFKLLDVKRDGLSSPVIVGASDYIAGKMSRAPHAEEAFGYAFEKIVLFAEGLGVGTTWIAGTMDRSAFEKAMGLIEGEVMPCVSPLGYTAKKMSFRESMMRKGIKADSRKDFKELFFDGSFENVLDEMKYENLSTAFEMVRLAPSAVNKQPWRIVIDGNRAHFYEKKSKGFISADGWDIQKIDMGIALCHFELGLFEAGLSAEFEICDPKITAPEDTEYVASYVFE